MGPSRFHMSNVHTCKETPRLQNKNRKKRQKRRRPEFERAAAACNIILRSSTE